MKTENAAKATKNNPDAFAPEVNEFTWITVGRTGKETERGVIGRVCSDVMLLTRPKGKTATVYPEGCAAIVIPSRVEGVKDRVLQGQSLVLALQGIKIGPRGNQWRMPQKMRAEILGYLKARSIRIKDSDE